MPQKSVLRLRVFISYAHWAQRPHNCWNIILWSGACVDGNAPYQAQELQITTLANPGIQKTSYLLGWFNPNTL